MNSTALTNKHSWSPLSHDWDLNQSFKRLNDEPIAIAIQTDWGNGLTCSLAKIVHPQPPKSARKLLYKAIITKADNGIHINSITDGAARQEYDSGFSDLLNFKPKTVPINWLKKNSKNEIQYVGINSYLGNPNVAVNPYDFEVTIYRVEKIKDEIVSKIFNHFSDSGSDPVPDPVTHTYPAFPIDLPEDCIIVDSEIDL